MPWSTTCLHCYFNLFVEKKCFSVDELSLIKLFVWNCFHRSISTLEKKCTFSFSKRKDHNISIYWVKTFHYLRSSSAMYIETGNQRNFKDYISSKVISSLFHDVMCSSWKKRKQEWITKEGGRITKRVGCYVASSAVVFIKKTLHKNHELNCQFVNHKASQE